MLKMLLENFMPHSHCFRSEPDILVFAIVGNGTTFLAYMSIPLTLLYLNHKHGSKVMINGTILSYALFVICCGIGHLIYIVNLWAGLYRLSSYWSAITAFWSIIAALLTFKLLDKVGQMYDINKTLEAIECQKEELKRK